MYIKKIKYCQLTISECLFLFLFLYKILIIGVAYFSAFPVIPEFSYRNYFLQSLILSLSFFAAIILIKEEEEEEEVRHWKPSLKNYQHIVINLLVITLVVSNLNIFMYGKQLPTFITLTIIFYSIYLSIFTNYFLLRENFTKVIFLILTGFCFTLLIKNKLPIFFVAISLITNFKPDKEVKISISNSLIKILFWAIIVCLGAYIYCEIRDGRNYTKLSPFYWPGEFIEIYLTTEIPLYLAVEDNTFKYSIVSEFFSNIPAFIYPARPDTASVLLAKANLGSKYSQGLGQGFSSFEWFRAYFGKLALIFIFLYSAIVTKFFVSITKKSFQDLIVRNFTLGICLVCWSVHFYRGSIFGSIKLSIIVFLSSLCFYKLIRIKN